MQLDRIKENMGAWWDSLAEGWRHLWKSGAEAITRFKPSEGTDLPVSSKVDDASWAPNHGWSVLGGNVFEDEYRVVVQLETPGMEKKDIQIELEDDMLVISGEKRFNREDTDGRWRVMQCAYGSFRRAVPLPAPVRAHAAQATYKNGVLRVELPKLNPGKSRSVTIKVQ